MAKKFTVIAHIPQLVSHRSYHSTTVVAGDFGLAAHRGFTKIKKMEGVKGKRIKEVTLKVTLQGDTNDEN